MSRTIRNIGTNPRTSSGSCSHRTVAAHERPLMLGESGLVAIAHQRDSDVVCVPTEAGIVEVDDGQTSPGSGDCRSAGRRGSG